MAFFVAGVLLGHLGFSLLSTWNSLDRNWVVLLGIALVAGPVLLASMFMVGHRCVLFGSGPIGPSLIAIALGDMICVGGVVLAVWSAGEPWNPMATFAVTLALWASVAILTWSALRTRRSLSEVASGHALVLGGAATLMLGISMWADNWTVGGTVAVMVGMAALPLGLTYWIDDWALVGVSAILVGLAALLLGTTSLLGGFSIVGLVLVASGGVLILVGIGFLPLGRKARVWLVRRGWLKNSWWAGRTPPKDEAGAPPVTTAN